MIERACLLSEARILGEREVRQAMAARSAVRRRRDPPRCHRGAVTDRR